MLPEQSLAISSGTFFLKNIVHLKVKFGHFVQLVAPIDEWLATFYVSNYSTPVNFKKKAEICRQILRYRCFCVFKASDFPSWQSLQDSKQKKVLSFSFLKIIF